MDKKINCVEIAYSKYVDKYDETGKLGAMSALTDLLNVLLTNEQMIKIWGDECAIVVEYDYRDPNYTGTRLEWYNESDSLDNEEEGEKD